MFFWFFFKFPKMANQDDDFDLINQELQNIATGLRQLLSNESLTRISSSSSKNDMGMKEDGSTSTASLTASASANATAESASTPSFGLSGLFKENAEEEVGEKEEEE